jgi:hypothetical protein
MLQNIKELCGNKLAGSDGDVGHVKDFYFDDKTWVIRYLVADTGSWLSGRLVLLSPHAFGELNPYNRTLHINLRKKQIEDSPSIEMHKPVSRQYEIEYYQYYGWPAYWNGGAMWGMGGYPVMLPPSQDEMAAHLCHHRDDKHLRSTLAVTGYHIHAVDGVIGHVTGFLVEPGSWAIGKMVVEAGHWYYGREILISPDRIDRISYEDSSVFVNLTKADIQGTAEFEVAKAGGQDPATDNFTD